MYPAKLYKETLNVSDDFYSMSIFYITKMINVYFFFLKDIIEHSFEVLKYNLLLYKYISKNFIARRDINPHLLAALGR